MKIILSLFLACLLQIANATTYYFSSTIGDDSRTAAQAQNPATPWRTLTKLNSFFSSLNPGDAVSLRRGDTFYGSITVTRSGTTSLPIQINAYGTGNKPIITGLTTLSNWTGGGNGVWESYNVDLGTAVNMVLLNNVWQEMGRYPNSNAANKGYLRYESFVSNTSISDNQLSSTPNWTGAEVVMRKRISILDRNVITSHSGNTLNYTSGSVYGPAQGGFGYFIQNDIKTLDQFGEWYYNPTQKKLFVYTGGNNPSAYDIKASSINNIVSSKNQSNIVFDNLEIKGANQYGFYIEMGSNNKVTNCDILFSGSDGVMVSYHNNFRIEACTVTNSNNNGMNFQWGNTNAVIKNNKVENSFVFAGMGKSGDGNGLGINGSGPGNLIEYNAVMNSGYIGISYQGNNVVIKNNYIDGFCSNKDDGGGIYTWVGETDPNIYYGRKIIGNIVLNGVGAPESTPDYTFRSEGISLDDFASGVEIRDNTVANCSSYGIYYRNARDIICDNNTFYNNKVQLVMLRWERPVLNNLITNNIFFSKKKSQLAASINSIADDMTSLASFDNNYYARPFDDKLVVNSSYVDNYTNSIRGDVYDLEGWQLVSQQDGRSKRSPVQIPEYTINSTIGLNLFANGDFNSNLGNVFGWAPNNNIITSWNTGKLDGGALQASFTSPPVNTSNTAMIYQKIGAVTGGKKYRLKFSLLGSKNNVSLGVYLRQTNSPFNKLTDIHYAKISTVRTENELVFSVPTSDSDVTLFFEVNNQNVGFWLDNIQLHEANVTFTNPDDYFRFEYNPTNVTKSVALDKNYTDVKGNNYSNSITLAPYSSIILMTPTQSTVGPDNTPPTIFTKNATVTADSYGEAEIILSDVIVGITDNSGVDNSSITLSQTQFTCPTGGGSNTHQAYVATTTTGNQNFGGELGMGFKVNNPTGIVINQLGAFDHQGNGIYGSQSGGIRVAIFNKATQTIVPGLDAIIIGGADSYTGNHRMKNIPAVTLMPGDYVVVAKGYNANELNGNSGGSFYPAGDLAEGAISYIGSCMYGSAGSGFAYPSNPDGGPGNRYLAGTFSYSTSGTTTVSHQAYIATTTTGTQNFGGELGMEFKVNSSTGIIINQLGAFDHQGNGISGTQSGGIRVAIFNKATQSIVPGLDAIIIGSADGYTGNHRMKNIPAVTLMPGDYLVVAKGYNANELNGNSAGGTPFASGDLGGGAISYASTCRFGSAGSGFAYPTNPDGSPGNRYLAGTFSYSTSGSVAANNNYIVTITAKDILGNMGQATATVTVVCNVTSLSQAAQSLQKPEELLLDSKSNAISVFPNPTKGQFSVQFTTAIASQVSVQILTINGVMVAQKSVQLMGGNSSNRVDFDLSHQSPGLYFVKIIDRDGIQTEKILLQH